MDDDRGKRYELGQCVVAGMRGVLMVWMRQSEMLEKWKENQNREFALYTVVGLHTSTKIEGDPYNHLQVVESRTYSSLVILDLTVLSAVA